VRRLTFVLAATAILFVHPASGDEQSELKLWRAVHIYSTYKMSEAMSGACKKWQPQASAVVDAAVRALHDKHAAKIEGAQRALSEKSSEASLKTADADLLEMRNKLDERFQSVPAEQRRDWCEKFPERIQSADQVLTHSLL